MNVAAIIPAAGRGSRLKSRIPKAFVSVMGKPILVHTLNALLSGHAFDEVVVLTGSSQVIQAKKILKKYGLSKVRVEIGGKTRAESVKRGVLSLSGRALWVLVHDAARPLLSKAVVTRTLQAAKKTGAALCVLPVTSTVKRLRQTRNIVQGTQDRRRLCLAQTPQVFRRDLLLTRYKTLGKKAFQATDEAALFDRTSVKVGVVPGEARNLKVTTPEDLALMAHYLRSFSCV